MCQLKTYSVELTLSEDSKFMAVAQLGGKPIALLASGSNIYCQPDSISEIANS